ncbi:unnamed protein product [Cylicocyclus nassatus]|uniref:Uncharacterized protein n=1 Tax=Cylicocyclus nassatus TaxID=53992 RepID=A0AA36DVN5_CYLNA|nr:unnamed protein product [Cylicocyclus nassatus]
MKTVIYNGSIKSEHLWHHCRSTSRKGCGLGASSFKSGMPVYRNGCAGAGRRISGNDVEKQSRKPEEQAEVQSSAPICELTPDSFVDSDLFLEVKGDPDAPSSSIALQPWSAEEGEISQSRTESEATPVKPEDAKDSATMPLLRAPRRRAARLWYSPQDTPEAMKNKKIKLTRMKAKADREFQCRISGCGKILHFKQSCRRQGLDHVRSHFPRKTRRCKICDYAGNTNASVYNHHTSCHPNEFYPGPLATETKEDLEELQHLFHQAFPEIPGIEAYMSMIS